MSPEFADIPSPISHNIDEITVRCVSVSSQIERRATFFRPRAFPDRELEEYNRLSDEYNRNEQTIPLLVREGCRCES